MSTSHVPAQPRVFAPLSSTVPPTHRKPGATPRPTDAEVRFIARRIARGVRRPPPDDQSRWLLSKARELAPEDEDRVEAALEERRAGR
jgi:hypothetical protein